MCGVPRPVPADEVALLLRYEGHRAPHSRSAEERGLSSRLNSAVIPLRDLGKFASRDPGLPAGKGGSSSGV